MEIPWMTLFSEASEANAWRVIGNGMHVAQCVIVWLYIVACGECVTHVRMSGVVSCSDEKGDVSDDDEEDCVMLGVARPEKSPIACAAGQTIVLDDDE